ncbi:hypothetical protein EIP86_002079 [Pleurotus ostreatoroseus]|nr:hypothetical protein EIP86_002079 [Pleurotus ostreatoroseus]
MPTHRRALPLDRALTSTKYIRSKLFQVGATQPVFVDVLTVVPRYESQTVARFPCFEAILGVTKPIQECFVECVHGESTRRFIIAAQYDHDKPVNIALKRLHAAANWRGNILVMKAGRDVLVTGLHGSFESLMVDRAVKRFLETLEDALRDAETYGYMPMVPPTLP